jgi:hypothetical protein
MQLVYLGALVATLLVIMLSAVYVLRRVLRTGR